MCGIGGWAVPSSVVKDSDLNSCLDCIRHRGPDDKGAFSETIDSSEFVIGLGHRRLSILDLEGGVQPMQSPDRKCTVVFNGEIYNFSSLRDILEDSGHVFSTKSDTEVLLNSYLEWGVEMVERIKGQFSFAIWDSVQNRLLLARDHFGLKPLYFSRVGHGLVFASEIKAILGMPGTSDFSLDEREIPNYLQHRYVPNPNTFFSGVSKLRPGHYATWNLEEGLKEVEYFQPFELRKGVVQVESRDEIVKKFSEHLERSVRMRMVSDVPFGAFLSGGVDSASIVAIMSKISRLPIKTFSVGFEVSENSELEFARMVAEEFECDHHELIVKPEDLPSHLEELIGLRDAPVAEPSDIPIFLLSKFASKEVKMVLTGEGSDEILGGYEKYFLEVYGSKYRKWTPRFIRESLVSGSINLLPEKFWRWKMAINTLNITDNEERMAAWFGGMRPSEIEGFLINDAPVTVPYRWSEEHSEIRNLMDFDQRFWLPDNLLERGDRMTMAASIEARMPFMDVELAEFVSSLPDKMRVRSMTTKRILRDAMSDRLPKTILERPKVGFRVPVMEWFRGELADWLSDLLLNDSKISEFALEESVIQLLGEHRSGKRNHEKVLWSLASLEIFLRKNFD